MGDESEWKRAPTEEKIEHKNWKARLEGYEECCKLFRQCSSEDAKNPVYLNYLGLIKKFVVDTNEVAKEKGLEAVLTYVENVPAAGKSVGEVIPGIINKCLNSRPKTRDRAIEIAMMYIEIEKQEIVQEELIKGLDNKQPKVVQSCLEILRRAINEFGSKTIPIKPIIKFIPKLLEDRDKTVRDEAKLLIVEMYKWAGAAILPQLQGVKPTIMSELEEEFKNLSEKPRQTRFLRSQQDLKAKLEAEMEQRMMNGEPTGGVSGDGDQVDAVQIESVDPYDLMEPADILSKMPKDFKEKLEAKKWQERKEVLDNLLTILQKNPRLVVTDYYELANDLKKIVAKDSNVNIVVVAAKCITGLASGLRKDFHKYALMCLEPLMERFKEKKTNIIEALREACDAIYPSTNLELIQEMCVGYLAHKTPVVRQQVALFLARCFAMCTQTTLPKKVLKLYLPQLLKNLSDADPSVRDSSAEALGAIFKALGEKIFMPVVGADLEPIKLEKIKEFADKVVLLNLKGEPRAGAAASAVASKPAPAAVSAPGASSTSSTATKKPTIVKPGTDSKPKTSEAAKKDAPKKAPAKTGAAGGDKKPALPDEPDMAQEVVEDKAIELFGAENINNLANSNWKERQSALENLLNQIKRMPSDEVPCQVIVRIIAKKPGFKDAHFQVLKQRLELVTFIAEQGFKFTQRSASYCLIDIADKIGDVKTSQQAKDALCKIGEQCTLAYVVQQIVPSIFESKNPKNQEHLLLWLSQAIREFGFTGLDMKFLLNNIKTALQNSNASIRSAAIQLISTIYMYVGPNFRSLFDQEKPALLEQIDAEIDKIKDQKPPAPIRGKAMQTGGSKAQDADADEADEQESEAQKEALIPRTDISAQLTDALMEQLNDKNWKERQAALERIETILRENKFVEANIGEFPTHLNKRFVDSNKILATSALKISEKLAMALGSQGKRYVGTLAPGMIQALSDNKENIRKTAIASLSAWFDNCGGLVPFLEGDLLIESFASATNPNIKSELCGWLSVVLGKCKVGKLPPELKAIIPHVYAFIEDRNPEVRTKAQELVLPLMMHVGANDMLRVLQKAKPTSVTVLQPIIEKARAEMAAKQPAPVQAKPAAAAAAPTQSATAAAKTTTAKVPISKSTRDLYADSIDDSSEENPLPTPAKKDAKASTTTNGKTKDASGPGSKASVSTSSTTSKKKNNEDEDFGPIMQVSNKTKRVEEEKALKTLKWNFDVPRKEFTDQLKAQMETAGFNRTLMTQLFHDDFKYHISALQTLTKAIEDFSDATVSNLDLILRWLTLRFFETNPTVILKAIEYMQALFGMLANVRNYHMIDYEAGAFIPYFIGKLGDPKDPIRKGFRQIIKQISQCYAPVKVFNYLIQGLTSKNSRQRAECLEECGQMIEALGLNSFSPQTSLKEIAKCIGDRDNGVRNAALNSITIAYQIAGEQVYKFIGKLNEKDMAMLEERIKRSSKTTAIKVSASGNLNQVPSTPQMPTSASMSTMANINSRNNLNGNGSAQEDQISSQMNNGGIKMPLPRLNTSPKTQQTPAQLTRPVFTVKPKGEFSLDLKDDEESSENVIPVRLTSHQDLDELLNKPVDLPPPRKNLHAYPINILKESQDCREAIDLVITHISHQKIDVSIQNLVQIDVVIKDKEKRDLLIPHVDTLLYTCALKMNVAHNIFLNNEDTQNSDDVFKLFKGIFSVLIDTFDNQLGKNVTVRTLKEVFFNLLSLMTDQKLLNYNEGEQLIKAINVVTLKLLETSDQTTSYCSLVKLLTECCDQENFANNKYLELLMKCLWRQIRRLSAADVAFVSKIDANQVLSEINTFLKKYPSNSWQAKDSDLPLRTVKTLLYHLSKTRQSTILEHLDEINAAADSEIRTYVMKLFKNNFQLAANGGNATNNSFGGAGLISPNQKLLKQGSPDIKPSSNLNSDQLTAIIKKISNVETSKEGLYELYDLKKLHPDMDLNKYFKNSSGKLQSYIQENLKQIEQERNGNIHRGNNENLSPEYISSSSSALGGNRKIDELMKTINDWKSNRNLNQIDTENVQYETAKKSTFSFSPEKKIVAVESENVIRAERYLDLVQDLKKKYTRSRTEPINKIKPIVEEESDQLSDLGQFDLKFKNLTQNLSANINTASSSNGQANQNQPTTNGNSMAPVSSAGSNGTENSNGNQSNYAQMSSENLYDEYKRRLELIKKIKPPVK